MAASKHIDKICCACVAHALIIALLLMIFKDSAGSTGVHKDYGDTLFDSSVVHTIDIQMDDWDSFISSCEDEEYVACDVVIDGVTYKNVGIRAKGNTSLSSVSRLGSSRYSFKIEFDCYGDSQSYNGLDKLSLNNIIQDNTYMKDFLCYWLMGEFGADAPLCSYSYITVNGNDWGLYLAVEGVEESFLERNYGTDYGELYKPDSSEAGGGRGNGRDFAPDGNDMGGMDDNGGSPPEMPDASERPELPSDAQSGGTPPEKPDGEQPDMGQNGGTPPERSDGDEQINAGGDKPDEGASRGSDDVLLVYSDDDPDSYPNIFDNAKTKVSSADKARLISSLKKLNAGEDLESVVNIDEVMRYFVVHNFVCNFDSYTGSMIHNYYLYESDGQLSMIPWDYNLAFGGFESGAAATSLVNYPIDDPVLGTAKEDRPMLAWIFESEEYTQLYHEYMEQFISEVFTSGKFTQLIDSVTKLISPYVERDPTKFCTYEKFETGVSTLRQFCLLRADSISDQLSGLIPSTKEGQQEDNSSLIDASAITISNMGGMDNTMQGGQNSTQQKETAAPTGFGGGSTQTAAADTQTPLIIVCIAVPAVGIAFALLYKRRH